MLQTTNSLGETRSAVNKSMLLQEEVLKEELAVARTTSGVKHVRGCKPGYSPTPTVANLDNGSHRADLSGSHSAACCDSCCGHLTVRTFIFWLKHPCMQMVQLRVWLIPATQEGISSHNSQAPASCGTDL